MRIVPFLAAAAALWAAAPVWAQDAARAQAVARQAEEQLRSPVTPSHTLDMCPSPEADALRDTVLSLAMLGRTPDQIIEDVIARRGEQLRIVPEHSGVGLWAWLLPPAVLVGGAGVVVFGLMRLRRGRRGMVEPAAVGMSDAERERVAAALRQFERGEAAP